MEQVNDLALKILGEAVLTRQQLLDRLNVELWNEGEHARGRRGLTDKDLGIALHELRRAGKVSRLGDRWSVCGGQVVAEPHPPRITNTQEWQEALDKDAAQRLEEKQALEDRVAGDTASIWRLAEQHASVQGIPVSSLVKHLRKTRDAEGVHLVKAVASYREAKARGDGGIETVWGGVTYPTRRALCAAVAKHTGLAESTVDARLRRHNWDVEAMLAELNAIIANAERVVAEHKAPPPKPAPVIARGQGVQVTYDGRIYPSKLALARHLMPGDGLAAQNQMATALMYDPDGVDLKPRLDYLLKRPPIAPWDPASGRARFVWRGRLYFTVTPLVRELEAAYLVGPKAASAMLWRLGGDIDRAIDDYARVFFEGERAVLPPPIIPENIPAPSPPEISAETAETGSADLTPFDKLADLVARARLTHASVHTELRRLIKENQALKAENEKLRAGIDPSLGRLQAATNRALEEITLRLKESDRLAEERRQEQAATKDQSAVLLHKVNQLTHDFEVLRDGSVLRDKKRSGPN